MNIISIDLPWKSTTEGGRALVIANLNRNIRVETSGGDEELLRLVQDNIEQKSIVLLDIPIEGCGYTKNFRPIDRALLHQGISIQPISSAENRGKELKSGIQRLNRGKSLVIQEIYPYAVYKFLAYLRNNRLLPRFNESGFAPLLGDGFRGFWPRRYKRKVKKKERLENMKYLYSLLTDPNVGLKFSAPLDYPDSSYTVNQLKSLADKYDACLGAIVGIYWAEGNPYAWVAGDPKSGEILLLADKWLKERLEEKRIQMKKEALR
jgi:predicted RNase H-like nuclease